VDDDNDNEHRALLGWILGIAIALSVTIALTSGIVAFQTGSPAPAAAVPAATPAAAPAPAPAATGPVVAKVYFATGAAALPAEAAAALQPVIDAARGRPDAKLAVSGFHDKTGNPEQNAELAKQRAIAVRDALVAAGVAETRIELRKPQEMEGGADDREARRVEVGVE
jgi:cytochrome c oxidase subunit 2